MENLSLNVSNNLEFTKVIVQIIPVLGISLVLEARSLVNSFWWECHNKSWKTVRLFLMLFTLALLFVSEMLNFRHLENVNDFSNLETFNNVTLGLVLVILFWLPIEEIAGVADIDGKRDPLR